MMRLHQAGAEMAAADHADERLGQETSMALKSRFVDAIRESCGRKPIAAESMS